MIHYFILFYFIFKKLFSIASLNLDFTYTVSANQVFMSSDHSPSIVSLLVIGESLLKYFILKFWQQKKYSGPNVFSNPRKSQVKFGHFV